MAISNYLFFNGNCAEAMRFYEKTLGGKLDIKNYSESPDGVPANADPGKVMHAHLALSGGDVLMASDDMSGSPYRGMNGFAVAIFFPSAEEARRIYDLLADGGQVWMPMGKTFWSEAFGMFADRYGTPWMVSVG
jgi:PhnB protein